MLKAVYDFPAKHWQSIRTTNPKESTFATILASDPALQGVSELKQHAVHDVRTGPVCREKNGADCADSGNWAK